MTGSTYDHGMMWLRQALCPTPPRGHSGAAAAALVLAAGICASGCGPELAAPRPEAIDPDWGWSGEDTEIAVTGQGFWPRVEAVDRDELSLDRQYRVFLETDPETELRSVEVLDYQQLVATVPEGLDPGVYDLRVEAPSGRTGTLSAAFEVRDTRADRLSVTTDDEDLSWEVLEFAVLELAVLDREGARVAEDLPVEISIDEELAGTVLFQTDTLEDQEILDGGTRVRGSLGRDGRATVALTSTLPVDELLVRFAAAQADAGVTGTGAYLAFTAGAPVGLELSLPERVAPHQVTAGEDFDLDLRVVDAYDNTVEDASAELALLEGCAGGTFFETVSFVGATTVRVELTQATGDVACEQNAIVALGVVGATSVSGQSPDIEVLSGDARALSVEAWPDSVVAGDEDLYLLVDAVDAWGNRDRSRAGSLSVRMVVDGGPPQTPAEVACEPLIDGRATCRVRLETAGDEVVLTVATVEPEPILGSAAPVTVEAGVPVSLAVSLDLDTTEAGATFPLSLRAVDELDNGVSLDVEGIDAPTFEDSGTGDVDCVAAGEGSERGEYRFDCVATVALAAQTLDVALPSWSLAASTDPFRVVNGPLAQVSVDLGATSVVAGEDLPVSLVGRDAWGNPFVVQDDPDVDLIDLTGTLEPSSLTLDAAGRANTAVRITTARDDDQLRIYQSDALLGSSTAFDVVAGAPAAVELSADTGWVWWGTGDTLDVQATVVDAHGNPADSFSGTLVVRHSVDGDVVYTSASWTASGASHLLSEEPLEPSLDYEIELSAGGLTGSIVVQALDPDCSDGPTAALGIAGSAEPRLCLRERTGSTSTVSVSAAGSSAGSAALHTFHFDDGEGEWTTSSAASWTTFWSDAGAHVLSVVVADADACGDIASATAWVGPSDGSATGPIDLVPDATGLGSDADLWVAVTAVDCAGDPAGGELLARVDAGALTSATVDATGAGLSFKLDALGEAELAWTAGSALPGGSGTLVVGKSDGSAYGAAQVELDDDALPPRVIEQVPAGTLDDAVSTIQLQFSEPLLDRSVRATAFSLVDDLGDPVVLEDADLSLSDDGTTVTLSSPVPLGTDHAWTLGIGTGGATVRDLAGNRLDGAGTGSGSAYSRTFGGVADAAPDTTIGACARTPATFRPDGDDGAGLEADQVRVTAVADAAAAWWRLDLIDAAGHTVRTTWTATSGSGATLYWDGRGDDGLIAASGAYTVQLTPADSAWNTGLSCQTTITLDQHVEAP